MSTAQKHLDFMRIPSREIKVWAWILVFTLMFNASFPGVAKSLLFSSSEKVLLCVSGGYKWVSLLTLETTEKSKSHCLMCLNNDDSDAQFQSLVFVLAQAVVVNVGLQIHDSFIASPQFLLPRYRAPPVFFSS